MVFKSKQAKSEEQKTLSITETRKLRLAVLKPANGFIEIVNTADQGRVCFLRVKDFRSVDDAVIYAEVLRLAPELLDDYPGDTKRLVEVIGRLERKVGKGKRKRD